MIAHPPPPSPPTSPLSLPFLLRSGSLSLSLSLCLCEAFHFVLIACLRLTAFPFFSVVQWLHERSAVWTQARLVEEVKAEVGTPPPLSFHLIFREWRAALRLETLQAGLLDEIVIFLSASFLTGSYSTAVPPQLAIFVPYFLCSWHA